MTQPTWRRLFGVLISLSSCSADRGAAPIDQNGAGTGGAAAGTGGSGAAVSGAGGSGATSSGGAPNAGSGGAPNAGSGGALPGNGGSSSGAGGSLGGSAGVGGSASGGAAGSGGTPSGACPANASFCSDFEQAGLPAGSRYTPAYQAQDWQTYMAFDTSVVRAGAQSLRVNPGAAGYDWRMLAVPAPGATFWVRLYVRSDIELGQSDHNSFFQAMTGDGEPNNGDNMEVSEQFCQVVLNLHDVVVVSQGGGTACDGSGIRLSANTWHCMEAFFDGPNGVVQVYADGNTVIDSSSWSPLAYQNFSFGFLGFHGPARTMWYDDVAVAPSRIGCAQ